MKELMSDFHSQHFRNSLDIFDNVIASKEDHELARWQHAFRTFSREIERRLSQVSGSEASIELTHGARAKLHMLELLPALQAYMTTFPKGEVFDVLDVECGHGLGTDLLGSLFLSSRLGHRCRTSGCQTGQNYIKYARGIARSFTFLARPIAMIERNFHILISIFRLQRAEDPLGYCKVLQNKAEKRVFLLAPFEEPLESLTKGHTISIDQVFLLTLGAENIRIFESPAWGAGLTPPLRTVCFELPSAIADESLSERPSQSDADG